MRTELYWIEGPWRGRLAIMPRPRGGDWLEDEIQSLASIRRRCGRFSAYSRRTNGIELARRRRLCRVNGIEFVSFPIVDRSVPSSVEAFSEQVIKLAEQLADGKNIAVHCRQGIGRAALVRFAFLSCRELSRRQPLSGSALREVAPFLKRPSSAGGSPISQIQS